MRYEQLMFHYGNNAVTTLQFSQGEVFPFSRFAEMHWFPIMELRK